MSDDSNRCRHRVPRPAFGLRSVLPATLLALALLSGCSKQLLGTLDEAGANQVVSALRVEGVEADKAPAGEKAWRVTVPDAQFAEAVQILERRNLPTPQFQGLGQVFRKESLVSTPTEERARLIHALSQELERSLLEIDGVLVARVHPVILPQDPLNPRRAAASASVLIKHRAGADMTGREAMVRALVAAGIEGLSYDDVRVVMVPAEAPVGSRTPLAATGQRAASMERYASPFSAGSPTLYVGVGVALLALLLLSYAALQLRRRSSGGDVASRLHGRWTETVNGVIHAAVAPRAKPQRTRSTVD